MSTAVFVGTAGYPVNALGEKLSCKFIEPASRESWYPRVGFCLDGLGLTGWCFGEVFMRKYECQGE
jgi:hypothetical protein